MLAFNACSLDNKSCLRRSASSVFKRLTFALLVSRGWTWAESEGMDPEEISTRVSLGVGGGDIDGVRGTNLMGFGVETASSRSGGKGGVMGRFLTSNPIDVGGGERGGGPGGVSGTRRVRNDKLGDISKSGGKGGVEGLRDRRGAPASGVLLVSREAGKVDTDEVTTSWVERWSASTPASGLVGPSLPVASSSRAMVFMTLSTMFSIMRPRPTPEPPSASGS